MLFFHARRAWPCTSMEDTQEKHIEFIDRNKVKEKMLEERRRLLKVAGIVEGTEQGIICFGIVEGGTPCFVYSKKSRSRSRAPSVFSWFFYKKNYIG